MRALVFAVVLSLASAAGYALGAVVQSRLAAVRAAGDPAGHGLLRQPLWWWAVGLNGLGALLHVAALHYGPLTLVQPLGALTLVAALPLGAAYERRRVGRAEWRGALWTLGGLLALVSVVGPAAPGEALSTAEALLVGAATALLIAALLRGRPAGRGRLRYAGAAGVASGVASALTPTVTVALTRALPGGPVPWWQTAAVAGLVAVFATGGMLLSQMAFRDGLAAPLAVVNLANPAAAAVIGIALLGETFRAGPVGWLVAVAAAVAAGRGVLLLAAGRGGTGTGTETAAESEAGAAGPAPGHPDADGEPAAV
ncbi:DMT family transporter [Streptomyces lichenis]|uniref:DMT family transporter n=1 Tax=Streptomyces lichenis TaxID=2306967 RepID=A0ABT0I9W7_9ACTN|nr:DMT family transporter [Streptomyces lichenis]MCK8678118.1 DMT family transporter [Streptomyces lichenis]